VCGRCRGKLELHIFDKKQDKYVPYVQEDGKTPAKTPNAFAAFVKDNYKLVRTPGSKHGEAMKELSKMFAQTKLAN